MRTRIPTRLAQGGVALGLVMSMGAVVVTAQADERRTTTAVAADGSTLARAAAARASTAYTAQLRAQAVEAAQSVVDEVSLVRSAGAEVAVPDDVLAELDAATAALQAAIEDVDVPTLADRAPGVSRSADRAADEPTAEAEEGDAAQDAEPAPAQTVDATVTGETAAGTVDRTQDAESAPTDDEPTEVTLPDTSDPATTPLRAALDRVQQAAEVVRTTTEQKKAEAAAAAAAEQAAAEEAARVAAEQAAQRAAWKASLQGYSNGQVPSSALCALSFDAGALLRCDAAEALEALNAQYAAHFGTSIEVSDSYRSYSAQVACRANKGSLCAAPGTSNHGMGVAVDLGGGIQSFGTAQHEWMRQNAPAFQWTLPDWARAGGSKPEPWHWEYVG